MSKYEITAHFNVQAKPGSAKRAIDKIKREIKAPKINLEVAGGKKASRDVKSVANATKNLANEAKVAESNVASMSKMFGSALKNVLRYDIARRVFYAFAGAIEQGVKDAISFEREMVKIAQVSGQTMQQLKGLESTVSGLATSLGVSSSSLVKVGLILKQTGLSVKDTEIAMQALAKTELAPTFDNIADTAETAVAAMRQFGLASSQLEGLLGKINTVAANFAVEASDIGVAIKRAGGAFKAAGGQVEELIALFTSVRATTRETAETIATGFRTIFTRLQRPTTIKFLRQFGVELTDLNGKFVGPYEAVMRLNNALGSLDPSDLRFSAIVEQLGGFRQVSKVIPLIQQAEVSQAAFNAQMKAADSLSKDAEIAQQSLAVQMAKLTEEVKELFREMADSSSFQAMVGVAMSLAKAITAVGKAIAPVIPLVTALFAVKGAAFLGGAFKKGGLGGLSSALGRTDGRNNIDLFGTGGKVHKFSRGGWVPGTGNSDTVPAMLQPGEFVIRKSAAQAFGPSLEGINKYASGGIIASEAKSSAIKNSVWTENETLGQAFKAGKYFNAGDEITANYTKFGLKGTGNIPEGLKLTNNADRFEQLVRKMMGGTRTSKNAPIDVADSNSGNIEVKNTKSSVGSAVLIDKFARHAQQNNRKLLGNRRSVDEIDLGSGWGVAYNNDKAEGIQVEKRINVPYSQNKGYFEKYSRGGGVGSDTVPALLTPGEFVINKKSAQSIGYTNLAKMNRYNTGGKVAAIGGAAMAGTTSGLMDAVIITSAISSITSFATQAGFLSDSMAEVVTEFGGTLGQLKGINSALSELTQKAKDNAEFGFFASKDASKFRDTAKSLAGSREKRLQLQDSTAAAKEAYSQAQEDWAAMIDFQGEMDEKAMAKADKLAESAKKQYENEQSKLAATEAAIVADEKKQKEQQKQIAKSKAFTLALEIAGAAAIQFGNYLSDSAMKNIAAGQFEGQATRAGIGGGLASGVQAGMAGFMAFGKMGGLLAIPAAIFGFVSALEQAKDKIAQVKFEQTLKEAANDAKMFREGLISASSGLSNLEQQILDREALNREKGFFGGSRIDEATKEKARESQEASAQSFVKGLAKNVGSVDEFNRNLEANGKTLLRTGSIRLSLIDKMRSEINERLKNEEGLRNYALAQEEATRELLKLKGIAAISQELKSNIATSNAVVSGSATRGIGQIGSAGAIFENQPRSKTGIEEFNRAIDAIGRSGEAAGLDQFTDRVKANTAVERSLDEVLNRAAIVNPTGRQNIEDFIIKDLKDTIGPAAAKAVEGDLEKAFAGIDITNVREDRNDIIDAIKGVLGESTETFKEFSSLIDARNDFLKNSYQQLRTVETSYLASLKKVRDTRVKVEQDFAKNMSTSQFGFESNAAVQARFFARLDALAKPDRGTGTDVSVRNIDALRSQLIQLIKDQAANNKKLAQPNNANMQSQEELIKSGHKLRSEIESITSILNEYGNSQQRLTALNERLQRAREREDRIVSTADQIMFGEASTANEATKLVEGIQQAVTEGNILNVDPKMRLEVLKALPEFLGKAGEEIVQQSRRMMAEQMGSTVDFNQPSKERSETAKQIEAIGKASIAAMEALAEAEKTRVDNMSNTIETQNQDFLNKLYTLFRQERVRQAEIDVKTSKAGMQEAYQTRALFQNNRITQEQLAVLKSPEGMKQLDEYRRLSKRQVLSTPNITGLFGEPNRDQIVSRTFDGINIRRGEPFLFNPNVDAVSGADRKGIGSNLMERLPKNQQAQLKSVLEVMKIMKITDFTPRVRTPLLDIFGRPTGKTASGIGNIEASGLGGKNVIPNLVKFAEQNFANESIVAKFEDSIQSILLSDPNKAGTTAMQEIMAALAKGQEATERERQKMLQANPALEALSQLSKLTTDELARRAKSIKSLEDLNTAFNDAVTKFKEAEKRLEAAREVGRDKAPVKQGGQTQAAPTSMDNAHMQTLKDGALAAINQNKHATKVGSIYTHDIHSEGILKEILQTLRGQSQTGAAGENSAISFNTVDTTELDRSINNFSRSVSDLSELMSGPLTMEVGGEINVNVKLDDGAGMLRETESAFGAIVNKKVTDGINNFIRNGLRTSTISPKTDWVA